MARYRIVQRPCVLTPRRLKYEVESRKWLFFWMYRGMFFSLEEADAFLKECQEEDKKPSVREIVVKEYD